MDTPKAQRKKPGRKPDNPGEPYKRLIFTVDEMTLRKLLVLGKNNRSKGLREAVRVAFDRYQLTTDSENG
jgi:hypothetical protein